MARERLMGASSIPWIRGRRSWAEAWGGGSFGISGSGQGRGGHFAWLLTWDEEINVGLLCPAPNRLCLLSGAKGRRCPRQGPTSTKVGEPHVYVEDYLS
ncbi:hypothetical protein ACJRO7_003764 [Eucalyptus globulus]|uniref:Uncharacterized protein n=1 Tax=Eucalyptus globulus TaxID=34317 RepID=A0ABD3IWZ4_EUCGL